MKGARLRNISSGGALVECREEIPVGAEIQLDFAAGGLIDAKVRWTKGTQFGCPVQGEVQPQAAAAGETRGQKCGGRAELPERRRGRAR